MTLVAINRGGRKPKVGVRRYESNNRIVRADKRPMESEEDAMATALEARLRRDLGVEAWLAARGSPKAMREARERMNNQLRGYSLGRLLLSKQITQEQHDAGNYFMWIYTANARFRGWPSPNPRSISADMVGGGFSTHPEDSPEWIADMRRLWEEMFTRIYDLGVTEVFEAVKRTVMEDMDPSDQGQLGFLRVGLNAINRARGV